MGANFHIFDSCIFGTCKIVAKIGKNKNSQDEQNLKKKQKKTKEKRLYF